MVTDFFSAAEDIAQDYMQEEVTHYLKNPEKVTKRVLKESRKFPQQFSLIKDILFIFPLLMLCANMRDMKEELKKNNATSVQIFNMQKKTNTQYLEEELNGMHNNLRIIYKKYPALEKNESITEEQARDLIDSENAGDGQVRDAFIQVLNCLESVSGAYEDGAVDEIRFRRAFKSTILAWYPKLDNYMKAKKPEATWLSFEHVYRDFENQ